MTRVEVSVEDSLFIFQMLIKLLSRIVHLVQATCQSDIATVTHNGLVLSLHSNGAMSESRSVLHGTT